MSQSQASQVSQNIGWDHQALAFPTKTVAENLRAEVEDGNIDAYETVVRYNRFLPSATSEEERDVQGIIWDAVYTGNKMHQ